MTESSLLIIMSDEHQARAMGCAGHPLAKTPNLDVLAGRGVRFTNAYTPSPICVPARAAFAVGKHVHQTRLWDNAMPYDGSIPGWGHRLQAAGIPVESIGKLHYRSAEDPAGFDTEHIPMMVADGVGMVWASIRREDERVTGRSRMLGDYIGPGTSKYTEYDKAVVSRTKKWLEDRAASGNDQRWCLFVGLVAPHFPLVAPHEYFNLYPLGNLAEPKLHPSTGYRRHPWVEKQNAFMDSESKFEDEEERLRAIAAYYGLCSSVDHSVGQILAAVEDSGFSDNTTVVYTSDHGDNVGARGLWGKSNLYEESVAVPLIVAGPDLSPDKCKTPVSLLDLSAFIPDHFGLGFDSKGRSLLDIAGSPADPYRMVFSEYHAAGAVSGAFMIRRGRWKYNYYVGFPAELFDLASDPEELVDLGGSADHAGIVRSLHSDLLRICNPDEVDRQAFADQAALIKHHGGRAEAIQLGAPGATPPPAVQS